MKYLSSIISFVATAIMVWIGFATSTPPEPVQTSLLWKIEGNDIQKPSYLMGTMHLIQKEYFYFPEALKKIIRKSDVIVTEVDLEELNDQQKAMPLLMLKEGSMLDFFTPQQQDTLLAYLKKKLFLDKQTFESTFGKFKPFVLMQTMIQMEMMGKTESYEGTIAALASEKKLPTEGLESLEEQMSLFDGLTREQQAEMVMESIRNEERNKNVLNQMQGMYFRQQIDSLYWFTKSEGGIMGDQNDLFLDKRNQKWIPQLQQRMGAKQLFIAVGAAHLGGQNGVINLLRKQGYTVTPIKI